MFSPEEYIGIIAIEMADFDAHPLLVTDTVSVWDVVCQGKCKHKSAEECAAATYLVFPYRGIYMHHVGREEAVAEANQVLFINEDEPYQVSHPVEGGDSCLSIGVNAPMLQELTPLDYLQKTGKKLAIEIEVRNLEELQQVLDTGGVDRILLDNFNYENLRKAVSMVGGKYDTEASGGITIDNIRQYAECGVDYISVGALTHSVKSLDLSLKAV